MITRSVKEPAYREGDGIEVSLLWDDGDDWLTVSLRDARTGMLFEVDAAHDRALDVFYHPFSYATSRTVRGVDEPRAAGFGG
jgi:hypothetical protein